MLYKMNNILNRFSMLAGLTTNYSENNDLRFNLGYNYEMICDIMSIKYQSVRNLFCETIRILHDKMKQA